LKMRSVHSNCHVTIFIDKKQTIFFLLQRMAITGKS